MKKNIKEIKTTIIGLVLWALTIAYFVLPFFHEKELWQPELYAIAIGFTGGLLLLLAPDRFVDFLFGYLNKKK